MKTLKIPILLLCAFSIFAGCSKDSENENAKSKDLIIGEWLFISENEYRCGTDDIVTELSAANESEMIDVYLNDGTWYSLVNGERVTNGTGEGGTWKKKVENIYEIYFVSDNVTQIIPIEFNGNNIMKYNITRECRDVLGESLHIYSVYNKR